MALPPSLHHRPPTTTSTHHAHLAPPNAQLLARLERALDAREAELTELRARLDGDVAASERRWETAAAEATLVRSQLADVKRELSDAESKLQQKELAAAAAAAAEATLRERLAEAETQREAAALAASEERDAFEAEVKRLERALSDAEARADAATRPPFLPVLINCA